MSSSSHHPKSPDDAHAPPLRLAIVLATTEERCTVAAAGEQLEVGYAAPFPRPRADRVSPGSLVAVAGAPDGSRRVLWRWYDAVVLGRGGEGDEGVRLWEPGHGVVVARPRDPRRVYPPGSRAYLSAGLPGAEWWVAGPAVDDAGRADVELDEVRAFFTAHDLWGALT